MIVVEKERIAYQIYPDHERPDDWSLSGGARVAGGAGVAAGVAG
jgi:hypothetical protein